MIDKYFISIFVEQKGHSKIYQVVKEFSTFNAIGSEIVDASFVNGGLLVTSRSGELYYVVDSQIEEIEVRRHKNHVFQTSVVASEVFFSEGILVLCLAFKASFFQILVCLNFDEIATQGRIDTDDILLEKPTLISIFHGQLRDFRGNLFDV